MSATCPSCQAPIPEGTSTCPKCGCILSVGGGEDLLIGQVVGNLVLTQRLGAGGMGAVYLGEHRSLKTPYAVKVLHPQFSNNPQTAERFRREAVACSKLRHENVVFVTDFGIQDNLGIYIVMEFVQGLSLKAVLKQSGRLPLGRVARIVEQVCDAMHAAHRMEIVHRDLKPDNIIVLDDKSRHDFVKVLDFGIAHIASADREEQLTQAGLTMGTPTYMSPEQIMGAPGTIGPQADIYALGIMVYEMLTGSPPFPRRNDFELLTHHMATVPPRLGLNWADMKGTKIEALVAAMLEKKPEGRPANMGEVKRLLIESLSELQGRGLSDAFYEYAEGAPTSSLSLAASGPSQGSTPSSPPRGSAQSSGGTSPTLHLNTLIKRIKAQSPDSAAAALLSALPGAESLHGDAISAALWGVLQQELLDAPLDAERFRQSGLHMYQLMETVLSAHEGERPSASQEKIFRSLRNLMTLAQKDRQAKIADLLAPLMGHPLFPLDAIPKHLVPGRSGKWDAIKSVMTKEIKVPWTDKDKPRPPEPQPPAQTPPIGQSGKWEAIKSVMTKEIKVPWTDKDRPTGSGALPQVGQSGALPQVDLSRQSGSLPQLGQSGALPQVGPSGALPQMGQSGALPQVDPAGPAGDEMVEIDVDMVEEIDESGQPVQKDKSLADKLNQPVSVASIKSLLSHEIRLFGGKKKTK